MNINATLFVQMINFFVAYFLLKKFLFVPVLHDIECEQVKTKELIRTINEVCQLLLKEEQRRKDALLGLKKYFLSMQPEIVVVYKKPQMERGNIPDNSQERLDEFSEKLTLLLRKKLHIGLK